MLTDEKLAEVLTESYGSPAWSMDDVRTARRVEAEVIAQYRKELFQKFEAETGSSTEAEGDAFTHGYFCGEDEATAPLLARIAELEAKLTDAKAGFRKCEFCGCNTNAKARACCDKGREADRLSAAPAAQPMTKQEIAYGFEVWQSSPAPEGWHFASDKTRARVAFMDGVRYAERHHGIKEQP